MRTVIINRASPERAPYEEWLHDMEDEFIIVTKNEHVEKYSDFFFRKIGFSNFKDNDNVYKFIADLHKETKIDRIVATNEFDLMKAGRLRDYLGIPGQTGDSARAFRDKVYMKQLACDSIRIPKFKKVNDIMDLMAFIEEQGYPIVIKPVDSAGSVDVRIVRDEQQLNEVLKEGLSGNIEAEEYIEGDMYHVDGLYANGGLLLSRPSRYVNGCMAFQDDKYLGSIMLQPSALYDRLNQSAEAVLNALPTPDHVICFHGEFFHTANDEIVLCEIASRAGGGDIIEAFAYATGVNILRESVRAQCGGLVQCEPTLESLAGWLLIPVKDGILCSIPTETPFDWVLSCTVKPEYIGKKFEKASSSTDCVATILIAGKSEQQILERMDIVYEWMQSKIVWG